MKKIAVILSGCGHKDGAEITEAVSALISLNQYNVEYQAFAPNMEINPINHKTNEKESSKRNLLIESMRITRGNTQDIKELNPKNFDALLFPGGFGAATHLCTWGADGATCKVLPEVQKAIESFYEASKPIAAICIAPALIAKVLGKHGVTVTIGDDFNTISEIKKTGAQHVECPVDDYISDRECKVLTTPAYMYDAKPFQVFTGINRMVKELVEWA